MPFFPTLLLLCFATVQKPSDLTICIDPGHPSEVGLGTEGKKLSEIHVNWVVAKGAREDLDCQVCVHVVLTKKTENEFVKNIDRAKIANSIPCGLGCCDCTAIVPVALALPPTFQTAKERSTVSPARPPCS